VESSRASAATSSSCQIHQASGAHSNTASEG
jgi:hypothetical protein